MKINLLNSLFFCFAHLTKIWRKRVTSLGQEVGGASATVSAPCGEEGSPFKIRAYHSDNMTSGNNQKLLYSLVMGENDADRLIQALWILTECKGTENKPIRFLRDGLEAVAEGQFHIDKAIVPYSNDGSITGRLNLPVRLVIWGGDGQEKVFVRELR